MNAQEEVGKLIMPLLSVDSYSNDPSYREGIDELVQQKKVGGFCVFGGTAIQVAAAIKELRTQDDDLLFSCDCEFGLPMRLTEGGTEFPDAMAISKTGEPELARKVGAAIAKEMKAIGLQWNFAPVADVNSNPKNPIINTRSFGETPEIVSRYATEFMLGLQSESVAATAKHFPGHGDTSADSHRELPTIDRNWDRFQSVELPSFQALISNGVASVMTGHLSTPILAERFGAKDKEASYPATLSKAISTSLLRDHMNFKGVIVTDSLEMHAITKYFGEEEAALLAFEAGADVLLMPQNPAAVFDTLSNGLNNGRIHSDDVQSRVERIRRLAKETHIDIPSIDPNRLAQYAPDHEQLANEIANKAIEVTGTPNFIGAQMLILADDRGNALEKAKAFAEILRPRISEIQIITPSSWTNDINLRSNTILATFHRARGYISQTEEKKTIPSIVREIGKHSLRGMILFGSPYLDSELLTPPGFVIKTFSESHASVRAAIEYIQSL